MATSSYPYTYFLEKISMVIYRLLIHKGTARERLMSEQTEISLFLNTPMPTDFAKKNWSFVKEKLEKKPNIYLGEEIVMASITNSIRSMREDTASKVIQAIYKTEYAVRSFSIMENRLSLRESWLETALLGLRLKK